VAFGGPLIRRKFGNRNLFGFSLENFGEDLLETQANGLRAFYVVTTATNLRELPLPQAYPSLGNAATFTREKDRRSRDPEEG
jgi:hypothetical protein